MPLSQLIQMLIHKFEVGAGSRYLWILALALGVFALAFVYDLRAYRNLGTPEAMDAAQIARNISEGKGYTTLCIRPFSLYLLQKHKQARLSSTQTNTAPDAAQFKGAHPDLANAPVYPFVLAGLMKAVKFRYPVDVDGAFWSYKTTFWRYQPDFVIAIFNETLLLVVVVLTFLTARKLFDANVAWLAAALVLVSELLWQFSVSGLSTMLLLVFFLGLTLLLLAVERGARDTPWRTGWFLTLAAAAGFLTGLGALTRYAFGWTIIPVALFLLFFSGSKRVLNMVAAVAAFAVVLLPWVARNESLGGTAFGTAGYAVVEGTYSFPRFQLERSLHPDLAQAMSLTPYVQKLFGNVRGILAGDLLKSGFTWAGMLFFAGLFLSFRSLGARRLRYFILMCLGVFVVAQSLGRTQLSDLSPDINSENLLVLLLPLVFVFGAVFFFTLLDQMTLPLVQLRYVIIAGFVALCSLPLAFALLPPKTSPVVYPPYYPPEIQKVANWMKPDELMMSDVPWAVAWYGQRPCLWLTLDAQADFFAINDYMKPVSALYLTPLTMDGKFVSDWVQAHEFSWGNFIVDTVIRSKIPTGFPLNSSPTGFLPDRLFLTDRERWKNSQTPDATQ